MLKHLIKFSGILLLLFLVACGGTTVQVEPAQPESPEQIEESAPIQAAPVEAEPVDAVEAPAEEEVLTVASNPQFIEFYADW